MNTRIVRTVDGKSYNSDNQRVLACKMKCGNNTTMTGTKLCDSCWEESRRDDDRKQKIIYESAPYLKSNSHIEGRFDDLPDSQKQGKANSRGGW